MKRTDSWTIVASTLLLVASSNGQASEGPKAVRSGAMSAETQTPTEDDLGSERGRISASYRDMEMELGIDSASRELVIDALAENRRIQNAPLSTIDKAESVRAKAAATTAMLERIRIAIGDERMEAYYHYMHSGRERHRVQTLNAKLPPEASLSAEQRSRLVALMRESNEQQDLYEPEPLWRPTSIESFSKDEQDLIRKVNQTARQQAKLFNARELDAEVENRAASFVTPDQLTALKLVNEAASRDAEKWARRMWVSLDTAKLAELQKRVRTLPRYEQILKPGEIEVALDVRIDDREPIAFKRSVRNGGAIVVKAGDVAIEVRVTRDQHGPNVHYSYFADVSGKRQRLDVPTFIGDSRKRAFNQTSAVEGVRRAYFVVSSVHFL
jgi:hypothetical protein